MPLRSKPPSAIKPSPTIKVFSARVPASEDDSDELDRLEDIATRTAGGIAYRRGHFVHAVAPVKLSYLSKLLSREYEDRLACAPSDPAVLLERTPAVLRSNRAAPYLTSLEAASTRRFCLGTLMAHAVKWDTHRVSAGIVPKRLDNSRLFVELQLELRSSAPASVLPAIEVPYMLIPDGAYCSLRISMLVSAPHDIGLLYREDSAVVQVTTRKDTAADVACRSAHIINVKGLCLSGLTCWLDLWAIP